MPDKAEGYTLFHTDGCHLCDLAMCLLEQAGIAFQLQDICDDADLAERYGTRIPVLRDCSSEQELHWPFDILKLTEFAGV